MRRIGIDVGALYLKLIVLSNGKLQSSFYCKHFGNPLTKLRQYLANEEPPFILGYTGAYSPLLRELFGFTSEDMIRSLIAGVQHFYPDTEYIIDIGGKGARLIHLENGRFKDFFQNTLCAAGTGSLLDQQLNRLGLSYDDLTKFRFMEEPPRIATRCAVFAKTDIMHRQQEGYSTEAMWNGLCRGLAVNLIQTLLTGRQLNHRTVLTGGVALNRFVVEWLRRELNLDLKLPKHPHLIGAIGAALLSTHVIDKLNLTPKSISYIEPTPLRPPLELKRSKFPEFSTLSSYVDPDGTEVRIIRNPTTNNLYLGIDIGSTSTKAVLIDETDNIIADFYRKTAGTPIKATGLIFKSIDKFMTRWLPHGKILGVATTGAGRKFIGLIVGADVIINEITAHSKGALRFDPEIETIFEIGGQDSKYVRLNKGNIVECNLNYICAAGTGSFIEEQALKLGVKIDEVGHLALGHRAPYTADRCTVFMEEDVERLLSKGYSKEEVLAAVLHSVVQNYLTKVVENRPIQGKLAFQGATARNIGLVAAFETQLNREILVSPYCHVLGAYGAALAAKEYIRQSSRATKFRGLDLYKRKIELKTETCPYCSNHCKITFAEIEGISDRPSWGYMCGREPTATRRRVDHNYELFTKRTRYLTYRPKGNRPTIGIPMVLGFYTYLPFWYAFFDTLGFDVITTNRTDTEIMELGTKYSTADFCLPMKVTHGHLIRLSQMQPDYILLPYMINMKKDKYYSYVCPYGQMFPSLRKLLLPDYPEAKLLTPVLDLQWTDAENIKQLHQSIGKKLGCPLSKIRSAWYNGWQHFNQFRRTCIEEGKKLLDELIHNGEPAIVILGRPYSICDERVSLGLPMEIANILKMKVIPPDFIPDQHIQWDIHKIFWDYGQTIVNAIKFATQHDNLFAIYITHFACGPDSFLITYAEEALRGKPFMILEVDEHASRGGYTTRIEAFGESINSYKPRTRKLFTIPEWGTSIPDFRDRKIWIPPMHPIGTRLFASAFRHFGYNAEALPQTDKLALNIGKSLTIGKECLPAVVVIGTFVKQLREIQANPHDHALFLATSDGPCRFGQYINLYRMVLDRLGYNDILIIAPSSYNAYAGLPQRMRRKLWQILLMSDILLKLRCKIKPYELKQGLTEQILQKSINLLDEAITEGRDSEVWPQVLDAFRRIPTDTTHRKPLVGIVGEIYVRSDPFSNENIISHIENEGGEAWLVPLSEWFHYTAYSAKLRAHKRGRPMDALKTVLTNWFMEHMETRIYKQARELLKDRGEPNVSEIRHYTEQYLPFECGTEAVLTVGRAIIFAVENGADIVVNVAPFTCMPGTLTTAIFRKVSQDYNIPIINMFYDGEEGTNDKLSIYLRNLITNK